jgi:membrane associated rhomboid family serine protease
MESSNIPAPDSPGPEPGLVRIAVRNRQQAMEWSLVLVSQGLETGIDFGQERGWGVMVSTEAEAQALSILRLYRLENQGWRLRRPVSMHGALFDSGVFFWVALMVVVFCWSEGSGRIRDAGVMNGGMVSHGQWWRLCTAITLHADAAHLAGNMAMGALLIGLAMGQYGTGVGLLGAFLAGIGGNLCSWAVYGNAQRCLGASGMITGAIGLLAAARFVTWRKTHQARMHWTAGFIGGLMIFVLTSLSPGTDIAAHAGGFVSGFLIGTGLALAPPLAGNGRINLASGILLGILLVTAWTCALGGT